MLKRILSFILAVTVAISLTSCMNTAGQDKSDIPSEIPESPASDFEYEQVDDYIKITKYIGQQTQVRIPASIDGVAVCVIGEGAFETRASLTWVHIPDYVQVIEKEAFGRCYYLETVTGCKGLVSVGESAFIYDQKLKEFPWEEKLQMIGEKAFMWCESLERIDIVSACDYIGNYAFRNCEKVEELNFADEVVNIGAEAFMAINISKLYYPYATGVIGDGAFKHCDSLTEITFDERVTAITSRAFQNNDALKTVVIPKHIESIGDFAFGSCFAITDITWENPELREGPHPLLLVTDYTVHGYVGSSAEHYVQGCPEDRNIKFEPITE